MSNQKVLIAVPTAEMSRQAKFWGNFMSLNKPENTVVSFSHGQSPAQNRNILIRQALLNDCTHIFFIDDDVLIPENGLLQLLAHDKDIVSGLYLMRNFPHAPIAFNAVLKDGKCRFKYLKNEETGLVEVANFGLGCCLIKIEVFKKIEDPWIRIGQLNPEGWTDDIDFFNRCREAGFRLFLDLDLRCGHMATVVVYPAHVDGQWITQYDTQGSGYAAFLAATPQQLYPDGQWEKLMDSSKHLIAKEFA